MDANNDKSANGRRVMEACSGGAVSRRLRITRAGMTLVEVTIALALATMMCAGLYAVGVKSLKFAQNDRLSTEARATAKQRLEEIMATGRANLAQGGSFTLRSATNSSTLGYPMVIQPRIVWHTSDGTVTQSSAAAYAEVHIDVTYMSLHSKKNVTETYSMVLLE
jgi:type II secretory pathway pseudopilin PulG